MLTGKLRWLPLALFLHSAIAHAQEVKLEPGKAVERQIAGAVEHHEQAVTILREGKDQSFEAQALNSLERVYLNRGETEKAVAIALQLGGVHSARGVAMSKP